MLVQVLGATEVLQVNGEEVTVGQGIGNLLDPLPVLDRLSSHLVEGGLDGSGLILGKGLAGNVTNRVVDGVERNLGQGGQQRSSVVDGGESVLPVGLNASGHDSVLGLGQSGVLITDKVLEGRAGGLENQQSRDSGIDLNSAILSVLSTLDEDVGLAGLIAVSPERVVVGLAVNDHASPAVADDGNASALNPGISVQEVVGELGSKQLEGVDDLGGLCEDVAGVLHGVGGDNGLVGGLGVRGGEGLSREEDTDGQVIHTVDLGVLVDLEKANTVLSILLLIEVNVDGGVGHCRYVCLERGVVGRGERDVEGLGEKKRKERRERETAGSFIGEGGTQLLVQAKKCGGVKRKVQLHLLYEPHPTRDYRRGTEGDASPRGAGGSGRPRGPGRKCASGGQLTPLFYESAGEGKIDRQPQQCWNVLLELMAVHRPAWEWGSRANETEGEKGERSQLHACMEAPSLASSSSYICPHPRHFPPTAERCDCAVIFFPEDKTRSAFLQLKQASKQTSIQLQWHRPHSGPRQGRSSLDHGREHPRSSPGRAHLGRRQGLLSRQSFVMDRLPSGSTQARLHS